MRKLGTAREVEALAAAADYCETQGLPLAKELRSVYAKLTTPSPQVQGADAAGIEHALVTQSKGRVIAAAGGRAFWIVQSRVYGDLKATVEDAELVGRWIANQTWLAGRQYTIDTLARVWPNYLARARAGVNE